jgi:hypothetical protein
MSIKPEACPICGRPMPAAYLKRIAHRKSKAHLAAERAILKRVIKRKQTP